MGLPAFVPMPCHILRQAEFKENHDDKSGIDTHLIRSYNITIKF